MLSEWMGACAGMGHVGSPMYYRRLRKQYAEPQRHYHNFTHITACLKALKRFFPKERDLAEVKMAIFFHDVVYDPMRKDNEERSAAQWVEYARARKVHAICIKTVERMILDTKTHKIHGYLSHRTDKILLDIDMSIFVADPKAYMAYAQNVWREYKAYGAEAYTMGRLDFLQHLDPDRIFYTPELRAHSRQAELNIAHEIATLQNGAESFLI
jgi:predicted metal-dependent HD superfamily phosphohydrolase